MMIFASDLDRTLIYSNKFVSILPEHIKKNIRLVERIEDEKISFMTEKAIHILKKLSKEMIFIPVTTRTIAQYKRIDIFKEIAPKYAIVSNGGNLIVNGEVDHEWNRLIHNQIKRECLPVEDVLLKFKEIETEEWVLRKRRADDLFSYCIVDREKTPIDLLNTFIDWLKERNWKVSLQGRKLYFVPHCVCKGAAIEYIKDRENINFVAASGDSLLDIPMLEMADYGIAPKHGEIYKIYGENKDIGDIEYTKKEGIFAAEEILEKMIHIRDSCF